MTIGLEKKRATATNDPPELLAPAWTDDLLGKASPRAVRSLIPQVTITSRSSSHHTLITAHIRDARTLGRDQLSETIYRCYMQIADLLASSAASQPIRFWNHICHIHEPMGNGMDRYMAFNVGRFRAFEEWLGGDATFDQRVATASGVGCRGNDIVIHALAADRAGLAVANPRQVQPFRYSVRYGPRPPCFARATAVEVEAGKSMLLIGGTASIRGEESVHVGDLTGQLEETFENLRALVGNAGKLIGRAATLANVTDLRVYVVDPTTTAAISRTCREAMPNTSAIQLLDADLCRKDLLVEIEGLAII